MKALTIARYCWLEAIRTKYVWSLIGILLVLLTASFFVRSIAITESVRMQLGVFAALARFASVLLITLHVASTSVRQFQDKETDLLFALDLTRTQYLLGRFAGYAAVCLASAAIAGLCALGLGAGMAALPWALSLGIELMLVAALTLFFVVSFVHIVRAVIFVCGFYLLARTISALQLISHSPLFATGDSATAIGQHAVDAVAWLLPRLDQFTVTGWLLDAPATYGLGPPALQATVYIALILAAALFDLHRREL